MIIFKNLNFFKVNKETNLILFFISLTDILTMLTTIPYELHFNLIHGKKSTDLPSYDRDTKAWVILMKIHILSSTTFHSISVWLAVYLAYFRLESLSISKGFFMNSRKSIDISKNLLNLFKSRLFTYKQTAIRIIAIFNMNILSCLPTYLFLTIKEKINSDNNTYYYLDESDLNLKTKGLLFKMVFYSQSIFGKFIPCLLLAIFTVLLVRKLIINKNKQRRLFELKLTNDEDSLGLISKKPDIKMAKLKKLKYARKSNSLRDISNEIYKDSEITDEKLTKLESKSKSKRLSFDISAILYQIDKTKAQAKKKESIFSVNLRKKLSDSTRTTVMLTIVCVLFLVAELPLSVSTLLSITMGDGFYTDIYMPLGDLMEMIVLISSSINFILYCSMSTAFREAFLALFRY